MTLLRSRQPRSENEANHDDAAKNNDGADGGEKDKGNAKSSFERNKAQIRIILVTLLCCIVVVVKTKIIHARDAPPSPLSSDAYGDNAGKNEGDTARRRNPAAKLAPMGTIIYGAKSKGDDTAKLVKDAIQAGFRHIATGGFHSEYDERGVGIGWKDSGVERHELYLQTLFLENLVKGYGTNNCHLEGKGLCPPPSDLSTEDQVHLSIKSSLANLQTEYIDSVLVHNFRATLLPYEETLRAWRVLETYVDRGTIRNLGIVSVHDKNYLTKLYEDTRIKPTIVQNRFHSNRGYDINLRPSFQNWGMENQLFWILTGSAGGKVRNNNVVKSLAEKMGVSSPQILLYSFTMELGGSPLIGSKSIGHMREDVDELVTNRIRWKKEDLVTMAGVINKNFFSA